VWTVRALEGLCNDAVQACKGSQQACKGSQQAGMGSQQACMGSHQPESKESGFSCRSGSAKDLDLDLEGEKPEQLGAGPSVAERFGCALKRFAVAMMDRGCLHSKHDDITLLVGRISLEPSSSDDASQQLRKSQAEKPR